MNLLQTNITKSYFNREICNNTGSDLSSVMHHFREAYKTGKLPEELSDIFKITILKGFNADDSDRMIIDWA